MLAESSCSPHGMLHVSPHWLKLCNFIAAVLLAREEVKGIVGWVILRITSVKWEQFLCISLHQHSSLYCCLLFHVWVCKSTCWGSECLSELLCGGVPPGEVTSSPLKAYIPKVNTRGKARKRLRVWCYPAQIHNFFYGGIQMFFVYSSTSIYFRKEELCYSL